MTDFEKKLIKHKTTYDLIRSLYEDGVIDQTVYVDYLGEWNDFVLSILISGSPEKIDLLVANM